MKICFWGKQMLPCLIYVIGYHRGFCLPLCFLTFSFLSKWWSNWFFLLRGIVFLLLQIYYLQESVYSIRDFQVDLSYWRLILESWLSLSVDFGFFKITLSTHRKYIFPSLYNLEFLGISLSKRQRFFSVHKAED